MGDRLQAIKWCQWKAHFFKQDDTYDTFTPYNGPLLFILEWDPREEHEIDFPHGWVFHPMAAAASAFLKTGTPGGWGDCPGRTRDRPDERFLTVLLRASDATVRQSS